MTSARFQAHLASLADCWARRDYAAAAAHFAPDVRYADPTRYALAGQAALLAFFEADDDREQHVEWHLALFDEARQVGAVEYTYEGTRRYHGVALVRMAAGRITHWREYQHADDRTWGEYARSTDGLS